MQIQSMLLKLQIMDPKINYLLEWCDYNAPQIVYRLKKGKTLLAMLGGEAHGQKFTNYTGRKKHTFIKYRQMSGASFFQHCKCNVL